MSKYQKASELIEQNIERLEDCRAALDDITATAKTKATLAGHKAKLTRLINDNIGFINVQRARFGSGW